MWKYALAAVALVVILATAPRPEAAITETVSAAPAVATTSREQWALKFLVRIGNVAPTYESMSYVVAWQGGENTGARFNPLATTQTMDPQPPDPCFNSLPTMKCGVKNYVDEAQGIEASAITIANGFYPNMFYGLQNNRPELALNAGELNTWGTQLPNVEKGYRALIAAPPAVPASETELRNAVVQTALAQVGKPYVLGTRGPDTFDCSGFVQWVWGQHGYTLQDNTFSQQADPNMRVVEPNQLKPGDAVYYQFSWDQHTGILADLDGDGKWDMIHAATPDFGVIIDYDVFAQPFWTGAIIGYRSVL